MFAMTQILAHNDFPVQIITCHVPSRYPEAMGSPGSLKSHSLIAVKAGLAADEHYDYVTLNQ